MKKKYGTSCFEKLDILSGWLEFLLGLKVLHVGRRTNTQLIRTNFFTAHFSKISYITILSLDPISPKCLDPDPQH